MHLWFPLGIEENGLGLVRGKGERLGWTEEAGAVSQYVALLLIVSSGLLLQINCHPGRIFMRPKSLPQPPHLRTRVPLGATCPITSPPSLALGGNRLFGVRESIQCHVHLEAQLTFFMHLLWAGRHANFFNVI